MKKHPTQFKGLSIAEYKFFRTPKKVWRFIDNRTGLTIGPEYPSREAIFADIGQFAKSRGIEN